ncbi:MAG: hypothetical protein JNM56_06270 [Planctomycetia bacterium]|nr:hypothetical protein [Planctomycetia bacterium]
MRRFVPLTVLVGLLVVTASQAEFVVFTDRTKFEESSYHEKTIDFEGIAVPGFQSGFPFKSGLTRQGVNFVGTHTAGTKRYLWVADDEANPSLFDWGSGAVLYGPSSKQGSDAKITVTLPAGITALGADLMTMQPFASNFVVTLASGDVFHVKTQDYPHLTFWGIQSTAPIKSLTFSSDNQSFPMMDNFTFGLATPAPPAVVLFALGSAGLLAYQRRRRTPPTGSTAATHAD